MFCLPLSLSDLIEVAPEVPDDLEKGTREMVALRCLEDLLSRSNGLAFDDPSTIETKVGFSLSESCEDVLQHIMDEVNLQTPYLILEYFENGNCNVQFFSPFVTFHL